MTVILPVPHMAYAPPTQPIFYVDSDEDDHLLIGSLLQEIAPERPTHYFVRADALLDYLKSSKEPPFLILSAIRLLGMSGIDLRQAIQNNDVLRRFSIPFILMSGPVVKGVTDRMVNEAFEVASQGFFEKKMSRQEQHADLKSIIDYWERSHHPIS